MAVAGDLALRSEHWQRVAGAQVASQDPFSAGCLRCPDESSPEVCLLKTLGGCVSPAVEAELV